MDIQWDSAASLMRVVPMNTTEDREELVARGSVRELVARTIESGADGLLLRAAGPDWTCEYQGDEIRELATQPGFDGTSAEGDTAAALHQQPGERAPDDGIHSGQVGGPTGVHPTT